MTAFKLKTQCPNCGYDAAEHNNILYDGMYVVCQRCNHGWYFNVGQPESNLKALQPQKARFSTLEKSLQKYQARHLSRSQTSEARSTSHPPPKQAEVQPPKTFKSNIPSKKSKSAPRVGQQPERKRLAPEGQTLDNLSYTEGSAETFTPAISYSLAAPPKRAPQVAQHRSPQNTPSGGITKSTPKHPSQNRAPEPTTPIVKKKTAQDQTTSRALPQAPIPKELPPSTSEAPKLEEASPLHKVTPTLNPPPPTTEEPPLKAEPSLAANSNLKARTSAETPSRGAKYTNSHSLNPTEVSTTETPISEASRLPPSAATPTAQVLSRRAQANEIDEILHAIHQTHSKKDLKLNFAPPSRAPEFKQQTTNETKAHKKTSPKLHQLALAVLTPCQQIFKKMVKAQVEYLIKCTQRIDTALQAFSYVLLIGGAVFFIVAFHHHMTITKDLIRNAANASILDNQKITPVTDSQEVNPASRLRGPQNNQPLSQTGSDAKVVNSQAEDKIVAFEKNPAAVPNPQSASLRSGELIHSQVNNRPTLVSQIKRAFHSQMLKIHQIKDNLTQKIEVYQGNTDWANLKDNTLKVSTTLVNSDESNPHLVRSLEIKFIDKSGITVGRRIILAHQIINDSSAVTLTLTINNAPPSTTEAYVFVKDSQPIGE